MTDGNTPTFRIPADEDYTAALGRAMYNWGYLEWGMISILAKLTGDSEITRGMKYGDKHGTAGLIVGDLRAELKKAKANLSPSLHDELVKHVDDFSAESDRRNRIFHGHPATAPGGAQRFVDRDRAFWETDRVYAAAKSFDALAIAVNETFHGTLKAEMP